ncbi:MAG: hypothetical protein O3A36_03845 [bacterium]|nr:hypothetical protein [bacterium]
MKNIVLKTYNRNVPFSPIGEKVQPAFVRDADEGSLSGMTSPHPNPLPNLGEGSATLL